MSPEAKGLPKWKPGWVGIEWLDTAKGSKLDRVVFITCRSPKCNRPLRIELVNEVQDTWIPIEPMVWENPCWWFCTECFSPASHQICFPDQDPLFMQSTEIERRPKEKKK